tara:strand:- start:143 stop:604 length:462 start_codon:yes stop_codon:yes gene_type:complete
MSKLLFYYLFIVIICYGCNDSPVTSQESTTTGGSNQSFISIDFGNKTNSSVEIILNTSENVSGFQFTMSGATVTSFEGGLADDYGFSIANNSNTGIVIGYSLSGEFIPAGSNDILTTLLFTNPNSELCLSNVILSSPNAESLNIDLIGDCIEY